MTTKLLLRISSGLFAFFLLGHSLGHFTRHQVTDPKAQWLQQQMIKNKFNMFGSIRSYDENYEGMSLNLIATLAVVSALCWLLSNLSSEAMKSIKKILLPLIFCSAIFSYTSFVYFFAIPGITCLLATATLIGAYQKA